MKKLTLIFVLTAALVTPIGAQAASPKPGGQCAKINLKQVYKNITFTCIKSGKKLIWNKGVEIDKPASKPAASSTPTSNSALPAGSQTTPETKTTVESPQIEKVDYGKTFSTDDGYKVNFADVCSFDKDLSPELMEIQQYFYDLNRCGGQLRLGKYSLGSKRSSVPYQNASNFNNSQPCKLVTPQGVMSNLGFTTVEQGRNDWANSRRYPAPKTVIQLVPVYSSDSAEPKNSPEQDYKPYLDFYKNWIEYSSDFGANVEIRIPASYIKMPNELGSYGLYHTNNHTNPEHVRFNRDLVAATDPIINFSGANIAIVVAPKGTQAKTLQQAALNSLNTAEGTVGFAFSQYAALASLPNGSTYSNLGHPFWWIHESYHAGYGFDDHYGDTQRNIDSEYGMGWLTMMTPWGGELTTWEKWIMGFMQDSQIQCLASVGDTTHWIAPSSVNTRESKSVIVPISNTKAVVIESKRPGGLDYKFPLESQGVLVYEVDLMKNSHGMGMKLSLPLGRTPKSTQNVFMVDYPLKKGEATVCNGVRIEVVDSGTFGDVVRITKA